MYSYREGSIHWGEPTALRTGNMSIVRNVDRNVSDGFPLRREWTGHKRWVGVDGYEFGFDDEFLEERRRRTRRLRVIGAIVTLTLLALTLLSTTFNVINFRSTPAPTTEPVYVAVAPPG